MLYKIDNLKMGCPKELEKDLCEIVELSRNFLISSELDTSDDVGETRITVHNSRQLLFKILGTMVSIISKERKIDQENILDFGLKAKFEEDVGTVIGSLKKRDIVLTALRNDVSSYLKIAMELENVFDFLV